MNWILFLTISVSFNMKVKERFWKSLLTLIKFEFSSFAHWSNIRLEKGKEHIS